MRKLKHENGHYYTPCCDENIDVTGFTKRIAELEADVAKLKKLTSGYISIFESINYMPDEVGVAHVKNIITKKLEDLLP